MRFWRGTVKLWKDLFYGVGNQSADLARHLAAFFSGVVAFVVYWNTIKLGQPIEDLGGFFTGLALLVTAIWAGVAAKDWVRSQYKDGEQ